MLSLLLLLGIVVFLFVGMFSVVVEVSVVWSLILLKNDKTLVLFQLKKKVDPIEVRIIQVFNHFVP